MHAKLIVASSLLAVLTSCALRSYSFPPRHGELPDAKALETAREVQVKRGNGGGLGDVYWLPFLAFRAEIYNTPDGEWPTGTAYGDYDSYGPFGMFSDSDACHYDEQLQLYERNFESQFVWGLYRSERNDVRVASGWRVDSETSILFGLLRWPSKAYHQSLPYDRVTADDSDD
jgi:hypothetical protein